MKIVKVDLLPLEIPITHKRDLGVGSLYNIQNILIEIYTDNGIIGIGEASPWEVFAEDSKSVFTILDNYLAPSVIGEDPFQIEKILSNMDKIVVGGHLAKLQ